MANSSKNRGGNESPVSAFSMYSKNMISQSKKHPGKVKKRNAKKRKPHNEAAGRTTINPKKLKLNPSSVITSKMVKPKVNKNKLLKSKGKEKTNVIEGNDKNICLLLEPSQTSELEEESEEDVYEQQTESEECQRLENRTEESEESTGDGHSKPSISNNIKFTPTSNNSVIVGEKLFKWLVTPTNLKKFFDHIWEKKPLFINRGIPDHYKHILSTPMIDEMLRNERILFSQHVDVTSYSNGVKEMHNPDGRALPHIVWDYYLNGCSIRLLSPQTFLPSVHVILATLQEYTGSFVGANTYLTPPKTQGFAPHYDDIEAFILQIEGKKLWRVYAPLDRNNRLPRGYSKDFNQDELQKPIIEVVLNAGDLLYFPRGFIHQAEALPDCHSLHLTISMYQKNSWADLFEKLIPDALSKAITADTEFRKGLPMEMHSNFGYAKMDASSSHRTECLKNAKRLYDKIFKYLDVDSGVDLMMKKFQAVALPPVLTDSEKATTVYGKNSILGSDGKVREQVYFDIDISVRLLRKNIMRVMKENGSLKLYYYSSNMPIHPGSDDAEPNCLEVADELELSLLALVNAYPKYTKISDLPVEDDEMKINLCSSLWEVGILMMEYPPKFE